VLVDHLDHTECSVSAERLFPALKTADSLGHCRSTLSVPLFPSRPKDSAAARWPIATIYYRAQAVMGYDWLRIFGLELPDQR